MGNKTKKNGNVVHTHSAILAASNAEAEVGMKDTIARNRACQPVQPSEVPAVPGAFKPTEAEKRRRSLRMIPASLHSEALHALQEVVTNEATFQQDLGELAPSPAPAKKLVARVQTIDASLGALRAQLEYHLELEDIAQSDMLEILEAAYREYEHRVDRMPQLAKRYQALVRFFEARSAAISAGIERSKAEKEKATKPVTGPTPA
jgi:hypothetical protein